MPESPETDYRLWLNDERTVEVCTRETPDHVWGPPVYLKPEGVRA